jgi:hypothetical protein
MKGKAVVVSIVAVLLLSILSCMGMAERESAGPFEPAEAEAFAPSDKAEAPEAAAKRESSVAEDEKTLRSEGEEAAGLTEGATADKTAALSAPSALRQRASGLKAGFADDNRQFNYFIEFLNTYASQVSHIPIPVEERIVLKILDSELKSVPNAEVVVSGQDGEVLCRGKSYADGSFLFFPSEYGEHRTYSVSVTYNQRRKDIVLDRFGRREIQVAFDVPRTAMTNIPLDLLFILDTTGSMGEEIQRLKATIELINLNLASLSSRPSVRFGMVLYKDRGDEYVTHVVPFTHDLQVFQRALDRVQASGGGDTPEDLQAALEQAMGLPWNRNGVRLAFIITDAPPHLDYRQQYTYAQAVRDARAGGIKIFGVGTGGLDLMGEVVLRQIAQYSAAKYIFLTYGETGESEGGAPGSVSHHTGANYQTDKLEAIIIRFAKEELSHVTDQPIEEEEEYFAARKIGGEKREETLNKLFTMAISQLVDYSTFRIPKGTPAAVLPLNPAQEELSLNSEYFTEQLTLSFSQDKAFRETFRILERKDLQSILEELELQLSDLVEGQAAVQVGSLLGAELLIAGTLYSNTEGYELFLKLMRVQTGEVLSVTKAVIDKKLGLDT